MGVIMYDLIWIFCLFVTTPVASQYLNVTLDPHNLISNPCTDQNHLFLAPGVLTAGGTNRACISRFYPEGVAHLHLILATEDRQTVTTSRELPAGDGGCLDISVPLLPNTKAELIVNLRYPEAGCTWERRLTVRISSGRVLLVHTERARYRPGETLRFRVLAFKPDLMPSHGMIDEIWIEGSRGAWEGSRITQWSRVRTRLGIAQLQYELDELAPAGKWTVRASLADGSQGSATFWVGNYDLPPFQLSVRHPARVLRTSERLVWTVCVRYPWSEAVEGMLVIRLRGSGGGSSSGGSSGVRTAVKLRAPRACHRHAAAARRVGLHGDNPSDLIIADFSFQEDGTRIWQNTTVVSRVVDKAVTLDFLTKHRAVISPGLPHKLKVKATRWDDKPAVKERVLVCRYPAVTEQSRKVQDSTDVTCASADTDDTGVATTMFPPGNHDTPFYRFEASLSNDTSTTAVPLTLGVQRARAVQAALGRLRAESRVARTFVPLYLHLAHPAHPATALTVHFVVITRGGVIYRWGATTQCPIANSANQVQTAPRYSKCPQDLAQTNLGSNITSDALLDRHQLRVMLPIKVTPQMCPDSDLIAYFYYKGELVSASKHIEMEECFVNKVEAVWLSRQVLPGSTASLQVSTPGPSLCALTVVDSATKWVHPPANVQEELMKSLRRVIDSHRNLTEYDAAGDCFLTADSTAAVGSSVELVRAWAARGAVRVLGAAPAAARCAAPPHALMAPDDIVPRTDFSEAWLWRLLAVGMNGSAVAQARAPDSITRFEAGVLCVSKNGVAVSQPAVLQVFREMFIHADGARRLRRGDSSVVRYRLFNYLYSPLSVQILILTDQYIDTPAAKVETVCIAARASIARRIEIRARLPGKARLNIRAVLTNHSNCGSASSRNVSDEVSILITIDPEGVPVKEHKSVLLCAPGNREHRKSEVSWTWPVVSTVPGTESLTVWTSSDAVGPLYADADSLVLLPRGCGEQNMARLATNLLALTQLPRHSAAATTAREHVARGFTRQLQYLHPAGGFSAFGSTDAVPSTWLTAFVIRYLRRAHQVLWPNLPLPPAVDRAERWLINQQMENGCFRNEGHVFHRELKGGLTEDGEIASVALTAYVITSLMESASPLPYRVLKNSLACLRALPPMKTNNPNRVYAHALLAYAFIRLKRYEEELRRSNEANLWEMRAGGLERDEELGEVMELLKMARRSGDYVWWETSSLSTSVEATSYALLSLLQSAAASLDVSAAAVAWLAAQRTDTGGFVSTQDTLVALEALTAWSSKQPRNTNLTVTAYSNGVRRNTRLNEGAKVPELLRMGGADKLHIAVEGSGCAVVQATRSYNTLSPAPADGKSLLAQVAVTTDGTFHCHANHSFCFCAAVVETCVVWTSSFPEMALLEVSLPGGYGADAALLYAQLHKPNTLLRRIELTSNSGKAMLYLGTKDGSSIGAGPAGHQCFTIHAVGPNMRTKPAYVRVQDYYRPTVNDTQIYTIPEDCPAKIVHETNEYTASDNLFTKAKSLTDSSEILITHEFSYEDIPEGIPLEDPLYENLTLRDKDEHNVDDVVKTVKNTVKSVQDTVGNKPMKDRIRKENIANNEFGDANDKKDEIKVYGKSDLIKIDSNNTVDNQFQSKDKQDVTVTKDKEITQETQDKQNEIKVKHSIKIRDEHEDQNRGVENPNLTDFHVIDTEKDLEVPSGIEGPVPAVVLPPQNFKPVTPQRPVSRMFHGYYPGMYYMPVHYNYGNRRYISSAG